ncbi:MAG: hypothetical protein JW880_02080 [Candidatus Thermoplasmatota archaeon]|nr:hypothetical protein [Candidatus Thermoplasmatota archaeon]
MREGEDMGLGGRLTEIHWIRKQADREAKKDVLPWSERVGQVVGVGVFLIVTLFFIIHQTRPTGFFTDDFSTVGSVLLYALLVSGIIPLSVRALLGRKNSARPVDAAATAILVIGELYFLARFTFDFSHFADPFPNSLEFLLDWISPTLAKLLLILGVVGGSIFSVYHALMYFAVRELLSEPEVESQTRN